ncbi:MAG: hypothetical protein Q4G09_07480 [Clostridia bacterium]|nr:hypothetical protein [Clostridia bacterium]
MKKIITIITIIIIIILLFFIKFNYKKIKMGNNISNKSADEIKEYILDINSYEANETITVESNKNTNIYVVNEQYIKDNNIFKRQILEPDNLNGISFMYDGTNLKIENSKLNLTKFYENYPYIGESEITLIDFINDYIEDEESNMSKSDEQIILETKLKNGKKYIAYKKLYINKSTGIPVKLEIKDITQKTVIYILYNEIKINNLQKEDILAFKVKELTNDI